MTENYYRTGNYQPDYTIFRGRIKNSDFGYTTISEIANRIIEDKIFNEKCRENINKKVTNK